MRQGDFFGYGRLLGRLEPKGLQPDGWHVILGDIVEPINLVLGVALLADGFRAFAGRSVSEIQHSLESVRALAADGDVTATTVIVKLCSHNPNLVRSLPVVKVNVTV